LFTQQGRQPCVQPSTWRTRSLFLSPQWQGRPIIPPGLTSPPATRRVKVEKF
jgi:hypothetical protein